MIIKILGFVDIVAVICLLIVKFLPQNFVILMALYLITKGILFMILGDPFTSFFDLTSGIYIAAAAYDVSHWIITAVVSVYIVQKAIISLI